LALLLLLCGGCAALLLGLTCHFYLHSFCNQVAVFSIAMRRAIIGRNCGVNMDKVTIL
jgi:hypothetical protein